MKQLLILLKTNENLSGLWLRITLALVLFPHGCQLMLGWFGGPGFSNAMNYFTQTEGLPAVIAFLVIMLMSFGSLLMMMGCMTKLLSLSFIILFVGMIATTHWQHGFFMNWMGNQSGEGFEYHILLLGISLSLLFSGAGAYSLDAWLARKWTRNDLSIDLSTINL